MEYRIVSDYLGGEVNIHISEDQYNELAKAIDLVLRATDAEELFIVCVYNYEDYEHHLLQIALGDMVYQKHHYSDFWAISTRTHQRLGNILSSCRAYLDQIKSIASKFGEPSSVASNIGVLTNQWYDKSLSYRIMEGLRNVVQHRGFGVHGLTLGHTWTSKGENKKHRMHVWLEPHVLRSRLVEDGSVKKSVLAELGSEIVPINPHVREYMSAMGEFQSLFRSETMQAVHNAKDLVNGALNTFRAQSEGGSTVGAKAVAMDGGERVSQFALLRETLEYHDELTRKVNTLTNLELRVIGSAGPE